MYISKALSKVVQLERGIAKLYTDALADTDDVQLARALETLAAESQLHVRQLESHYGTSGKAIVIVGEGIKELLSLLSRCIVKVKEDADPVAVLQAGIEIEGYMEHLYKGLSYTYEFEEDLAESRGEAEEATVKSSEVFRRMAADERRHQAALQGLASGIAEECRGR